MKIYTKLVLDWDGNVLEEESFQYTGKVLHLLEGGGGGTTTNTVQKADPWKEQEPYLIDIFEQAKALNETPGPNLYPGQTIAQFTPEERYAQAYATSAAMNQQQPLAQDATAANRFLTSDVLRADSNPYMADYARGAISPVMEALTEQALPAVRSGAIASGQFGGAGQRIGETMAIDRASQNALNTTSQMYSDMYGRNLEAMQKGLALAPGTAQLATTPAQTMGAVGGQIRSYEQALLDDEARRYEYEQQLPYNKLAAYQNLVQGQYGGTGTASSTGVNSSSMAGNLLGAAGTGLSTYGGMMALGGPMAAAAPWAAGGLALLSLFS